jgi:hypothetical protein
MIPFRAKQSSKTCKHAWNIELPEEPKQPEAPPAQKATVPKPSVQEKPKQEGKEEIDIEKIMAELDKPRRK